MKDLGGRGADVEIAVCTRQESAGRQQRTGDTNPILRRTLCGHCRSRHQRTMAGWRPACGACRGHVAGAVARRAVTGRMDLPWLSSITRAMTGYSRDV